ncbi:MAG: hypothetical protein M1828_000793 [Chrysothrix sp. TS-e1954]|nr:MAG: hypothetical protein M1828_000793 [Chrysothrix sp. TS-e1954]
MSLIQSATTKSSTQVEPESGHIDLVDNSQPQEELDERNAQNDGTVTPSAPTELLSKQPTAFSLREQLAKRKYRDFRPPSDVASSEPKKDDLRIETNATSDEQTAGPTRTTTVDIAPSIAKERLRRGRKAVKSLFSRKTFEVEQGDTAIDILYENQRGWFFFGTPKFSANTLGPFDVSAWQNAHFQPSPVSILDAQLPDPGWQWEWRTWYVDMSWDVDEEGWQYSFMFQKQFAWHGTHPFSHSFVRRRRWLRKRVRKVRHEDPSMGKDNQTISKGHKLNADYFTIHPAKLVTSKSGSAPSTRPSSTLQMLDPSPDDASDEDEEVLDMGTLLRRLKRSKVDREKISLVLRFMDQGGDELHYLADEVPHILSLFLFQYSRRSLLSAMVRKIDAASDHRNEHQRRQEPEHKDEKGSIDNLQRAIEAADKEIQRLEFWSDIKDAVSKGESVGAAAVGKGWGHGWQGVDQSGPAQTKMPKTDGSGHLEKEESGKGKATQ